MPRPRLTLRPSRQRAGRRAATAAARPRRSRRCVSTRSSEVQPKPRPRLPQVLPRPLIPSPLQPSTWEPLTARRVPRRAQARGLEELLTPPSLARQRAPRAGRLWPRARCQTLTLAPLPALEAPRPRPHHAANTRGRRRGGAFEEPLAPPRPARQGARRAGRREARVGVDGGLAWLTADAVAREPPSALARACTLPPIRRLVRSIDASTWTVLAGWAQPSSTRRSRGLSCTGPAERHRAEGRRTLDTFWQTRIEPVRGGAAGSHSRPSAMELRAPSRARTIAPTTRR